MALKKTVVKTEPGFAGELVAADAYFKVHQVSGDKSLIQFSVQGYTEKGGPLFFGSGYEFIPDMDGGNFIAQAYEFLKSLPAFSGAVDC